MKLYDLEKGAKLKIDGRFMTFDHIDGMYSYITIDDISPPNNVYHLAAWTPLKKVIEGTKEYYEIDSAPLQ